MADDAQRPDLDTDTQDTSDALAAESEALLTEVELGALDPRFSNRRYRAWLTVAGLLALATLTLSIIVIIIARARDVDREADFEVTLTAVWETALAQPAVASSTPTPAPRVETGVYPFAAQNDGPQYRAGPACDEQIVTGRVLDLDARPTDALSVRVWGDYTRLRNLPTGAIVGEEAGVWRLVITDVVNRRLWVQLSAEDRYFSEPVEIVFTAGDCAGNLAEIDFRQVGALN